MIEGGGKSAVLRYLLTRERTSNEGEFLEFRVKYVMEECRSTELSVNNELL